MKATDLVLRCFAEKKDEHWQAFCIDLCLAVQGESMKEVREKLDSMIGEYVYDALAGEDKEFAEQLMTRKSPLSIRAKYYTYRTLSTVVKLIKHNIKLFKEVVPVVPQQHNQI
jgi:hypothetical protein